jgi:tetratricopeptide (TPR) repeat protein
VFPYPYPYPFPFPFPFLSATSAFRLPPSDSKIAPVLILISAIVFLARGEDQGIQAQIMRARSLFEAGDYPAAERVLRQALDARDLGIADEVQCLVRLAQVLSQEDAHEAALTALRRALDRAPGERVAISRAGIPIALRAVRHAEAAELAAAVLEREPGDPLARFARGIARSREGSFEEAIPDLERGLKAPGLERDARFELALAEGKSGRPGAALDRLLEIIIDDPWDEEACYQATRQLIRAGSRQAVATAAHLTRYLERLKEASGPSSRDHHLQAAGRPAPAALLRAAKRERLGDLERMVAELRMAESLAGTDPAVRLATADSWARLGLLREADRVLEGFGGPDSAKAREEIGKRKESLRAGATTRLGVAILRVAGSSLAQAGPLLEELLEAARAAQADAESGRAARLLLVIDPGSARALRHLAGITGDPALLAPHLHYLARLAAILPGDPGVRSELASARALFLGKDPASGR